MPEEILFEFEQNMSRAEIAAYLRQVADNLEADGAFNLSAGDQSITVDIPDRPTFEIKMERETSSSGGTPELSIEFEMEWDENGDSGSGSLEIE